MLPQTFLQLCALLAINNKKIKTVIIVPKNPPSVPKIPSTNVSILLGDATLASNSASEKLPRVHKDLSLLNLSFFLQIFFCYIRDFFNELREIIVQKQRCEEDSDNKSQKNCGIRYEPISHLVVNELFRWLNCKIEQDCNSQWHQNGFQIRSRTDIPPNPQSQRSPQWFFFESMPTLDNSSMSQSMHLFI